MRPRLRIRLRLRPQLRFLLRLAPRLLLTVPVLLPLALLLNACEDGADSGKSAFSEDSSGVARALQGSGTEHSAGCAGALDSIVSPSGVAGARLWMSLGRFRSDCNGRDTVVTDVGPEYVSLVSGSEHDRLLIHFRRGEHISAERIIVTTARYITMAGVSKGSSWKAVKAAYPQLCTEDHGTELLVSIAGLPGVLLQFSDADHISDSSTVSEIHVNGLALPCNKG